MADGSKIEWTDATWNPITGCSVVSPGCTNCYAMKLAGGRLRHLPSRAGLTDDSKAGPVWNGKVRLNEEWIDQPLRWRRPRRIFVCAHGDLFHESVPEEWIDRVFAVMALCPQHVFQVLTKRPERMRDYLAGEDLGDRIAAALGNLLDGDWIWTEGKRHRPAIERLIGAFSGVDHDDDGNEFWPDDPMPLPNVWLGVSAEDQARADERIPLLLDTPAAVRFLSAEPLLGPIDLRFALSQAWKIKTPRRDWSGYQWPQWVPGNVRARIEDFWRVEWSRGPDAWLRDALDNAAPPLGALGSYRLCCNGQPLIEGRYVHAWNNIGRAVADDGTVHVVSAGGWQPGRGLDWIIAGGESGPGARPAHPDWPRRLRDQCQAAGVAFHFKQWGAWMPDRPFENVRTRGIMMTAQGARLTEEHLQQMTAGHMPSGDFQHFAFVGKKAAGRLLDGRTWDEMPEASA